MMRGRGGRLAMTTFGAGIGVGSSWERCQQRLRQAEDRATEKAKEEFQARAVKKSATGSLKSAPVGLVPISVSRARARRSERSDRTGVCARFVLLFAETRAQGWACACALAPFTFILVLFAPLLLCSCTRLCSALLVLGCALRRAELVLLFFVLAFVFEGSRSHQEHTHPSFCRLRTCRQYKTRPRMARPSPRSLRTWRRLGILVSCWAGVGSRLTCCLLRTGDRGEECNFSRGWDGMGWDGRRQDAMQCNGTGCEETGQNARRRDRMRCDGLNAKMTTKVPSRQETEPPLTPPNHPTSRRRDEVGKARREERHTR